MMVAAAPRWRDRPRGASVTIRVFLLDDHEVVRRGVRDLLEAQSDGAVVVAGEAGTAEEAYRRIPAVRPDVAILDVRLPDGDGVEVCREIRSRHPEIRCLMLTSFADDEALFDSIMAGAAGYVLKPVAQRRASFEVEDPSTPTTIRVPSMPPASPAAAGHTRVEGPTPRVRRSAGGVDPGDRWSPGSLGFTRARWGPSSPVVSPPPR
jgi:CheY-like chemotaxis protein